METSNPMLWLAWALFGSYLGWLVWTRYRPEVVKAPALPKETSRAAPAWLFCEDGALLDKRVQWFPLRTGGQTIVGHRPRASTAETSFIYLTADDVRDEHALLAFNPASGRYEVEALTGGQVHHNNEPLPAGEKAALADGDTLDLGRISRFRFTLTGPETS
jgi:hypothetical protein